jgi:hypothetical protein
LSQRRSASKASERAAEVVVPMTSASMVREREELTGRMRASSRLPQYLQEGVGEGREGGGV